MALVAALCAVCGVVCALNIGYRWQRKPVVAVLATVAALVAGGFAVRDHRVVTRLTNAASVAYDDLDIQVECRSWIATHIFNQGNPGWVNGTPDGIDRVAQLGHQTCSGLRKFLSDPTTRDDDARVAVHVLSHEAAHVSGVLDESATECAAIAHDIAVAEALGATADDAYELAVWYQTEYWPKMPGNYRRIACDPVTR